ncbi:TIGR04219 family outer membrane beta-barrel protein [Chromatiaceae bacterium AAb-1]|nr:TIGR04219 family outer membrane beta-barrel protein [Chromatiaceae bacterium AAb-1]
MKKQALMLSLGGLLLTSAVQADTLLGVYVGGDVWRTQTEGGFANSDQLQQFGFDDKSQASFYVALEHPIPLLPNIRIQHNKLESQGVTTLNSTFTFDDQVFAADTTVANRVDLSNTDYVLYYEILDNSLVSLDFGINAKHVKGSVDVAEQGVNGLSASHSASQFVPMIYTSAIVGLPFTGLDVFAQGSYAALDDNRIYDIQAGLAYKLIDNLVVDMRIKVGYRAVNLKLDDIDDLYTDLDFKGVFAGIELHF